MDNCFKSNRKSNKTKINIRKHQKKKCSKNKVKSKQKVTKQIKSGPHKTLYFLKHII